MKKYFIAALFIVFSTSLYAQKSSVNFEELFVIGKENSDNDGYIFSNITSIKKIAPDVILVTEKSDNTIRFFDENGEFLRSVGARGRGPGEFREVTSFEITQNEELAVVDRFQERITFFELNGNLLRTETLQENTQLTSQYIFQDENGNYHILYRTYDNQNGNFVHRYEDNFENKMGEYFDLYSFFFDRDNPLEVRLSASPRYLATKFGEDNLAIAPYSYTGNIGVMNLSSLTYRTFGDRKNEFYTEYDWDLRNRYRESGDAGYASMSGQGERYFIKLEGINFGLVGNENFLLQFYGYFKGKKIIPYLRVYDKEGNELADVSLEDYPINFTSGEYYRISPKFLDDQNRLYATDFEYKGKYTVARVFQLNLDDLLE